MQELSVLVDLLTKIFFSVSFFELFTCRQKKKRKVWLSFLAIFVLTSLMSQDRPLFRKPNHKVVRPDSRDTRGLPTYHYDRQTRKWIASSGRIQPVSFRFFLEAELIPLHNPSELKDHAPATSDKDQCVACNDLAKCVMSVDCSHMSICMRCVEFLRQVGVTCPLCRVPVTKWQVVVF